MKIYNANAYKSVNWKNGKRRANSNENDGTNDVTLSDCVKRKCLGVHVLC